MIDEFTLIGNLTRDPELRQTASGTAVTEVGVAVNKRVRQGNEWVEKPLFLDVTCWAKTAEAVVNIGAKGRQVYIKGRHEVDQWDDKATGQKRTKLKLVAERVQFLGPKPGGSTSAPPTRQEPVTTGANLDDEEIPF